MLNASRDATRTPVLQSLNYHCYSEKYSLQSLHYNNIGSVGLTSRGYSVYYFHRPILGSIPSKLDPWPESFLMPRVQKRRVLIICWKRNSLISSWMIMATSSLKKKRRRKRWNFGGREKEANVYQRFFSCGAHRRGHKYLHNYQVNYCKLLHTLYC